MNEDNKISVVINTYNAEKHLQKVLESLKEFDEIVICDMESTDRTLDIATRYNCHIVSFPKENHVSAEPARTFAIQSASSKWVLVVDADEIVTPQLREYLYKKISEPNCPAGLYIPRRNYFMHQFMHSFYPDYQLRFFIRKDTVWPPYVHTFPTVQGVVERMPSYDKNVSFIHLSDESVSEILRKCDLYTENEVDKKTEKNYGVGALIYRPLWRFFRSYLLKGGIRDGIRGFIHAVFDGYYQFVMVSKILERKQKHTYSDVTKK